MRESGGGGRKEESNEFPNYGHTKAITFPWSLFECLDAIAAIQKKFRLQETFVWIKGKWALSLLQLIQINKSIFWLGDMLLAMGYS